MFLGIVLDLQHRGVKPWLQDLLDALCARSHFCHALHLLFWKSWKRCYTSVLHTFESSCFDFGWLVGRSVGWLVGWFMDAYRYVVLSVVRTGEHTDSSSGDGVSMCEGTRSLCLLGVQCLLLLLSLALLSCIGNTQAGEHNEEGEHNEKSGSSTKGASSAFSRRFNSEGPIQI